MKEAITLGIPIVAIVDTNANPDPIAHVIPGNDDAVRGVKIIMDGANLFRAGETARRRETLNDAFVLLGPIIAIAHAKDLGPSAEHPFAAAGKGVLDFPYYLKLLKNSGYDGTLVMHGLEPEEVPESFAFLTEALKNA